MVNICDGYPLQARNDLKRYYLIERKVIEFHINKGQVARLNCQEKDE